MCVSVCVCVCVFVFDVQSALTSVVDLWSGGSGDLGHRAAHIQLSQSQLIHKVRQLQRIYNIF